MHHSVPSLNSPRRSGVVSASASHRTASPAPELSSTRGRRSQCSGHNEEGSSASSVGRRRRRRTLGRSRTLCHADVCRFPSHRCPSAVLLDPFPNSRIHSLCVAGLSTLVTAHRTGLRLYRERRLPAPVAPTVQPDSASSSTLISLADRLSSSPTVATASPQAVSRAVGETTGVFDLIETRQRFQVRDSYLCASMQTALVNGAVYLSKWSRYFCVASGSDGDVHSVSVMSSGAHFCLGHTKHQANKVVCMQCTHLALEPYHPLSLTPAVVSVDEVGTVVLFDIEKETASVLEQAPMWYRQTPARPRERRTAPDGGELTSRIGGDSSVHAIGDRHQLPLQQQRLTPEEEGYVLDTMEKVAASERVAYHLEHGVATRVALIGPCLELCNRCHNAFSQPASSSRGYKLVSVYLSSRAQDLPADAAQLTQASGGDGSGAAELNVVLLRVLWGPRRAFVLEELRLVQQAAPTDVCDVGIAMSAPPYQVGLPMTLLLARPALEMWSLFGCTGDLLETRRVYTANCDGPNRGCRRAASEFFLHWIPLGRHRLVVGNGDEEMSWFCTAAVTNDGTVLLLGSVPVSVDRCGHGSAVPLAAPHQVGHNTPAAIQKELTAESFKDADLEAWLDDISVPGFRCASRPEAKYGSATAAAPKAAEVSGTESTPMDNDADDDSVSASRHNVTLPYTVLLELYTPKRSSKSHMRADTPSFSTGVVSVLPDWTANRLLLFRGDDEALLSVPLPFVEKVATLTDTNGYDADPREVNDGSAKPIDPANVVDGALSSPRVPRVHHATPDGAQPGGMTQYLREVTSKAATAASQGWSSSIQRWTPSVSSHLLYFDASRGTPTEAQPAPNSSSSQEAQAPAPGSRAAVLSSDTATVAVSTDVAADSHEPRHFFSFTRPLMSALFHLTDEDEQPALPAVMRAPLEGAIPDVKSTGKISNIALSAPPTQEPSADVDDSPSLGLPPRAASAGVQRSGSPHHRHHYHYHCPHHRRHNSTRESSTAGSSRYRSTRRSSHLSSTSPDNSLTVTRTATIEDGPAVQASYMAAQMALLKEESEAKSGSRASATGLFADSAEGASHMFASAMSRGQYALRRLTEVEEPLARNGLLYAWKDGHNDLYIRFSVERDERRQWKVTDAVGTHAQPSSLRGENVPFLRDVSKRSHQSPRPHLTLCRPSEVENGLHSMGFPSQYNATVLKRAATVGIANCFDFSAYFATLQVPQYVLDLQERDKCRFELEDLRLQQAKDLARLHPYDMVTIFQNEERVDANDTEWRLHATFPYDDAQDGHAVDLQQLNRDAAGSRSAVAGLEWRWADASETEAWGKEHDPAWNSRSRLKSLMKELKDWEVGPWVYATRWPSREEELQGAHGFTWSTSESPEHRCRRRQLTRLRISIVEREQQRDLIASHQRELDRLREELGL
ncbi:hypothetical protein JKF63_03779 [Porcisia hertigi]|uniref:Uncharacterized protein n=1 Tax=Porcisia hertigi TaxID=2761500 RepID=A0A836IKT5_9TRYP|nr:hypothetical protein JKF63_03779 [Porcisia hertigi]